VHSPPGSDKFTPNGDPAAAFETFDHLISSPATVGSDRFNDLGDLYFGQREAIKLAFADHGTTLPEQPTSHGTLNSAQPLPLAPLAVPNMSTSGAEQGMNFQVGLSAVFGSIGIDPATHQSAPDIYSFTGRQGDVLNFEVDSVELARLGGQNSIDSVVSVYDSSGHLVPYYGGVAVNDDQFETTDSMLYDVRLPADGTYYVKVLCEGQHLLPRPERPDLRPVEPGQPAEPDEPRQRPEPAEPELQPVAPERLPRHQDEHRDRPVRVVRLPVQPGRPGRPCQLHQRSRRERHACRLQRVRHPHRRPGARHDR
jgi:hypothetical protein